MESAYLKGKMRFGYEETITDNTSNKILQDFRDNLILKNMERVFGCVSAHAILSRVSRSTMKSMAEILSDYDTFSRILKEVYTEEVVETEILDRLSSFGLREKII